MAPPCYTPLDVSSRIPFLALFLSLLTSLVPAFPAQAGGSVPGLKLTVDPVLADVGDQATFTASASRWPGATSVTLSFVSAHHGFTGQMPWDGHCGCFRLAVYLAKRVHALENARSQIVARYRGGSATTAAAFQIRGLAPGGANLAPGGAAYLSAWVGDPTPNLKQRQHFCGWVHTLDALGVPGYKVSFVAHPPGRTVKWAAGTTGISGLACSRRVLGGLKSGVAVNVDVYAGAMHVRTQFVPRA